MSYYDEDRDFIYATDQDWDRAEALELGAARPDLAWVATDRDVWHANPFYEGPPVPHPEMEEWGDEDVGEVELLEIPPVDVEALQGDDDIPF